jgi:hypothetical protein
MEYPIKRLENDIKEMEFFKRKYTAIKSSQQDWTDRIDACKKAIEILKQN